MMRISKEKYPILMDAIRLYENRSHDLEILSFQFLRQPQASNNVARFRHEKKLAASIWWKLCDSRPVYIRATRVFLMPEMSTEELREIKNALHHLVKSAERYSYSISNKKIKMINEILTMIDKEIKKL